MPWLYSVKTVPEKGWQSVPLRGSATARFSPSTASYTSTLIQNNVSRPKASIVLPATAWHTAIVIFANGLGDTVHGWGTVVENWRQRQNLHHLKFTLSHTLT